MPSPKYRLETLGTVVLKGPDVSIRAADHRQQRRRLALLTALATAGEKGMSRDQLLLLFWPESTQKKAKHSLDQLLYAIRQSLDESIFLGTNPIRLNTETISSDVGEFNCAISQGRYAEAAGLYQGAFLEGFYLSDTREFEEWADSQRQRLEKLHEKAVAHSADSPVIAEPAAAPVATTTIDRRRGWTSSFVYVVGAIAIVLGAGAMIYKYDDAPAVQRGTSNVAAYDLYLRAKDPVVMRSDSLAKIALANFQEAAKLDPGFAAAQAGIATMYTRLALSDLPVLPRNELKRRALMAVHKAIALDESLAEAHTAAGLIYGHFAIDYRIAARELERAIELDPSDPHAREYLAVTYVILGERDKAMATIREAVARDPLSPTARAELGLHEYLGGRCDLALPILDSLLAMKPPLRRVEGTKALCLASLNRWSEAEHAIEGAARAGGLRANGYLGFILARAGRRDEASAIRDTLRALVVKNDAAHFDISIVSYALGDKDDAFAELGKSIDAGWLPIEVMGPPFNDFRRDPRFAELTSKRGVRVNE